MGLQAVSASEQEKVTSEQPVEEVPAEAGNITNCRRTQVEAAVPSEQAVEEAPVKAVVPSKQPEDDFASEAYLLNNR